MTSPIGTVEEVAALGYDNNDIGPSAVTAVTATSPLTSTGGETPDIAIPAELWEGWDDVPGDISQGTANAALTYEAIRNTPFLAYHFRNNQLDSLSMRFQMPHSWDSSVAPVPHLHVSPQVAPSSSPQNVRMTGYWVWTDSTTPIPILSSWTPFTCDFSVTTAGAFCTGYENITNVTVPVGLKGSAMLLVYIQRDGGQGADTYTTNKSGGTTSANLALISFDCHVKKIRVGSPTVVPI
jgi:hypothetical protein